MQEIIQQNVKYCKCVSEMQMESENFIINLFVIEKWQRIARIESHVAKTKFNLIFRVKLSFILFSYFIFRTI